MLIIIFVGGSTEYIGVRGGAVGWDTALKAGRSQVRFPIVAIGIFHWHILSGRTMALGSTQPLAEMSTRSISWGGGKGGRCVRLTTLPPSCADCLIICGLQTPGTLSRPVHGLLDLSTYIHVVLTSRWRSRYHRSLQCHRWRRNPHRSCRLAVCRWCRWSISGSRWGAGRNGIHLRRNPHLPDIWNRGTLRQTSVTWYVSKFCGLIPAVLGSVICLFQKLFKTLLCFMDNNQGHLFFARRQVVSITSFTKYGITFIQGAPFIV